MDKTFIDALRKALSGPEVQVHKFDEDHQYLVGPADMHVRSLKEFLPPPDRIKQKVELLSVAAFLAYVERQMIGESLIFANEPQAHYEAVLDYHGASDTDMGEGGRGWCEHVAVYTCPQSEQWKIWTANSGKMKDQETFARFIEENLREVVEPFAADLLQLCLNLDIHKTATFESELRLDNGQRRFRYQEEIRGNTKTGDIDIPTVLGLQMPVFVDGAVFGQPARFRYRIESGKLTLGYELIRSNETYTAAVKKVTEEVKAGTEVKLVLGCRRS
jgi:uncharacterized protein YfdQ (DUF2303 family)